MIARHSNVTAVNANLLPTIFCGAFQHSQYPNMYMKIYGVEIIIQLVSPAPMAFSVGNSEDITNMRTNAAVQSLSDAFVTKGLMMGVIKYSPISIYRYHICVQEWPVTKCVILLITPRIAKICFYKTHRQTKYQQSQCYSLYIFMQHQRVAYCLCWI